MANPKSRLLRFLLFLSLLVFFAPLSANGAADRFSILNFRIAPDGGEYFATISTTSLYKLQWNVGTTIDYAYKPLEERNTDRDIIDRLLTEHFYGAIGLTDWLSFGFEMPIAWMNRFSNPDTANAPFENKLDLGDPVFRFKLRILDRAYHPVGIAFSPYVTAPLGRESRFMGSDSITGGGILALDAELKRRLWLALNVGVDVHKPVEWRNVDQNRVSFLVGGGASLRATDALLVAVDVFAKTATNHFFSQKEETPAEFVGGLKYNVGKTGIQLNAGGGVGLVRGVGGPKARGFAGLSYKSSSERTISLDEERIQQKYVELKPEEKEMEKVIALRERCPKNPADYKPGLYDEGCPKYYEMKEVADLVSRCPSRPADFDPRKHSENCQKVYTLSDKFSRQDAETIYAMSTVELAERCPANPADFNPKAHDQGCPKYYELKEVTPLIAKCPSDPKKFNPRVDDESCPKVYELQDAYQEENWMTIARLAKKDFDNDGIPDLEDKCPRLFGIKENEGCPLRPVSTPVIVGRELSTRIPITFKFNSYEITNESSLALGELAEQLIANPRLGKVLIEGYADVVGPRAKNKIYSIRRAEVVKKYLEYHGVDPSVLTTVGHGATDKFPGGNIANRRVIFTLVE